MSFETGSYFSGGPLDGQYIEVERGRDVFLIAKPTDMPTLLDMPTLPDMPTLGQRVLGRYTRGVVDRTAFYWRGWSDE